MWQKFLCKTEIFISLIILPFIFGGVYIYKRHFNQPQKVTYEQTIPWDAFEESYKAINGFTSFYGNTLKELQKMEQKKVAIYGYMYPIRMAEKHNNFLLSRQPHICQFHIPAHSGNMVEVIMADRGLYYLRQPILLTGVFSIPNDKESGIIFRLEEAELVDD